jgi:probable rRNA maturation factor
MAATLRMEAAVESGGWGEAEPLQALAEKAFAAAAEEAGLEGVFDVSLLFCDDAAIRILNRDWRGKDKATNVLSFPGPDAVQPDGSEHLGDVALAHETVMREAAEEGKPFNHHVTHLLVHGFLHLAGYDHEDEAEAEDMERLERVILARLAIPDPYAILDADD